MWNERERSAWRTPPRIKPSEWAERYRRLRRGSRKGPWRNANAPYLAGIMDIVTTPGCVQANLRKGGQLGGSELTRTLTAFYAHTDPAPMGLTLPSRDKGRSIIKTDVLPLFRHTPVLRELIGSEARDALIESITLLNGFSLDLMWSGSATSLASNPYQRVINDEVDKFEPWAGEEADAIAATEGRLTSYEDRRLQFNVSTPTTTAGKIHKLFEESTVKLHFHVPCPHCGHWQPLRWANLKYMDLQCAVASWAAARAALGRETPGPSGYEIAWDENQRLWVYGDSCPAGSGSPAFFASDIELGQHAAWLEQMVARLGSATSRRELADVLAVERERAVWYECRHCRGRITPAQKPAMIRSGRWTSLDGYVTDAAGVRHEDAATVERWPHETRIGFAISALYCTWIHWGRLAGEWLRCQGDPAALFFFTTFRLAEPFEFRACRLAETVFAAKSARAALEPGIAPRWAWVLIATIDTQPDHFYCVVRAWGGGMRSARVWHGKLMTFDDLDRLLFVQQWPVEGGEFPPMAIAKALIDSGGTMDKNLDVSRTQQVYQYAIPRQGQGSNRSGVSAIKGANRPGIGIYWPMKNPMSLGGKVDVTDLRAIMVDPHKANDLLSELIAGGVPSKGPPPPGAPAQEQWLLNKQNDAEYNAHMAAVQRTVDPRTKAEIWTPKSSGARHDYRDCEAYQVVAAWLCDVPHLPDEAGVLEWKRELIAAAAGTAPREAPPSSGGDGWAPRPL